MSCSSNLHSEVGDSIFSLITQLCEKLVNEDRNVLPAKKVRYLVKKSRSSMYETLLGKKHVEEIMKLSEGLEYMSPMSHLIAQRFALNNLGEEELSNELNKVIKEAYKLGWQSEPDPILRTLICLLNSPDTSQKEVPSYEPFYLSHKFGLTGENQEQSNRVYPIISSDIFKPPPWMNIDHSVSPFGSYSTSFPFDKAPGVGLSLPEMFCTSNINRDASEDFHYQLHPIPPLLGPRDLTSPSNENQSNFEDEGYVTPMTEVENLTHDVQESDRDPTQVWSEALKVTLPRLKSWETIGELVTPAESPFLSTASHEALKHLSVLVNVYRDGFNTKYISDTHPTSREEFVRDLFLLLIGIESSNFPFIEETDSFVLRQGLWLEGYCVDDTSVLCQDYLFCGTQYRRLEKLCHSPNTIKDRGLIIQSLNDFVQRWIQFYYGAVMILSSHIKSQGRPILLYELLDYVQVLKQQVDCLSQLCHVSGPTNNTTSLPSGVALLAHMYREASMSNCLQSHLLYSALKSCCEVYLHCLERWIFLGDCSDDNKNEFFVHRDHDFCNHRDRSFWTRGFVLDRTAVPDFLQGLEGAIFDCGRAMNLLQLCNPQHPLCIMLGRKHPAIHCCLFKSDMLKVQKECAEFEEEAQKICEDLMNVSKLFEEESKQEARLHLLTKKVQRERMIARETAKLQLQKKRAEMKEKQNADLKAQILAVQTRKAEEKERIRIEDEKYLLECERLENARKMMEEEERLKMITHYEELGKIVDKQNKHREWQLKRLKMSEKRQAFLFEDSLKLGQESKLLSKDAQSFASIKIGGISIMESSQDVESALSSNTVDMRSPSGSLSSSKEDNIILGDQASTPTVKNVQDLQNEAAANKAKVLQIEFDLGPNKNNKTYPDSSVQKEVQISLANENVLIDGEAHDVTDSASSNDTCSTEGNFATRECGFTSLEQNRLRVLTENECWAPNDDVSKKQSKDSGIISERERNRLKVLDSEYNILTGAKCSNLSSESSKSRQTSEMSDLEINRKKILNAKYNILTGEKPSHESLAAACLPVVVIKSDSGIDISSSHSAVAESHVFPSSNDNPENQMQKKMQVPSSTFSRRPEILLITSGAAGMTSPLMTPHSHVDMPVFTSPFKGTNRLPNELPLASPLLNSGSDKATSFEVKGVPLMIDIMDSLKFQSCCSNVSGDEDTLEGGYYDSEHSKKMSSSSFLESSLQTCLLLPLRLQYRYVSATLLHFFLVDLQLVSHFKSLRSFYFMQDGEFSRHLTIKLFTQMYQVSAPKKLLNFYTLNKMVKEALAGSQGGTDPNRDRLSLSSNNVPHHFSHSSPNVLDCLELEYKVQWPLNLLLTRNTLEKYNLIFVFLVRWKRVAWLLQEDFVALKNSARGCLKEQNRDLLNSPQYHEVQMIRCSMSQFVQATLNYVSSCVLHASWTDFAVSLQQATTLDHIYNAHVEYMKRLLKRCLLNTNSKRVEAVLSKILIDIIKFHSQMRVRPWQVASKLQGHDPQSVFFEHPNFQSLQACAAHFKFLVCKLVSYLERLVSPPNQQQHLAEYLLLLNINGFYKSSDYLKHAENPNDSDCKSVGSSIDTTHFS